VARHPRSCLPRLWHPRRTQRCRHPYMPGSDSAPPMPADHLESRRGAILSAACHDHVLGAERFCRYPLAVVASDTRSRGWPSMIEVSSTRYPAKPACSARCRSPSALKLQKTNASSTYTSPG
jgi:hypothetical protein